MGYCIPYVSHENLMCEVESEDRCLEETFTHALAFPIWRICSALRSEVPRIFASILGSANALSMEDSTVKSIFPKA